MPRVKRSADVLAFTAILTVHLWIIVPVTSHDGAWNAAAILSALVVATVGIRTHRVGLARSGLRLDNLADTLPLYLGCGMFYAGAVLVGLRHDLLGFGGADWPEFRSAAWRVVWAFLQEFCLLGFLLNRLRDLLGRDGRAVFASATLFAFFHLPNPFLTAYTFGGGLIISWLFLRRPNLLAAAFAHAAASALVSALLPGEVTGWMKVGPLYLWRAGGLL